MNRRGRRYIDLQAFAVKSGLMSGCVDALGPGPKLR